MAKPPQHSDKGQEMVLDVVYFHGNHCSLNKRSLQRMGPARSTLSQSQKENSCNLLRASPHVLSVLEGNRPNGINTETMGLSKLSCNPKYSFSLESATLKIVNVRVSTG